MTIGAFQQGATNSAGAYTFTLTHTQNNTIGVTAGGLLAPTIGAFNQFAYDSRLVFVDGASTLAKPTVSGAATVFTSATPIDTFLVGKPYVRGTVVIIPPTVEPEVPTFTEGEDNGSLLKMNTNIRRGVELIRSGDSTPIIDLDGIRYLLDVDTLRINGTLIWTRFSIATRQPLDSTSFNRRYAAHNIFGELLFSQGQGTPMALQTSTFPIFDIPADNGTVSP